MIIEVIKGGAPLTDQERQQIKDIWLYNKCCGLEKTRTQHLFFYIEKDMTNLVKY